MPKSRPEYWVPKLTRNKQRDEENYRKLTELGWRVLVIWECEINSSNLEKLFIKIRLEDNVINDEYDKS